METCNDMHTDHRFSRVECQGADLSWRLDWITFLLDGCWIPTKPDSLRQDSHKICAEVQLGRGRLRVSRDCTDEFRIAVLLTILSAVGSTLTAKA